MLKVLSANLAVTCLILVVVTSILILTVRG